MCSDQRKGAEAEGQFAYALSPRRKKKYCFFRIQKLLLFICVFKWGKEQYQQPKSVDGIHPSRVAWKVVGLTMRPIPWATCYTPAQSSRVRVSVEQFNISHVRFGVSFFWPSIQPYPQSVSRIAPHIQFQSLLFRQHINVATSHLAREQMQLRFSFFFRKNTQLLAFPLCQHKMYRRGACELLEISNISTSTRASILRSTAYSHRLRCEGNNHNCNNI